MESFRKLVQGLLREAIAFEFDKKGGIIVFSTDVNAVVDGSKFVSKIRSVMETIKNRMNVRKKVTGAIKSSMNDNESFGFTLGRNFSGRYYDSDSKKNFDEKSYTLEIIGISNYALGLIARNICKAFNQKMVLVKEYDSGRIYMEDTIDDGVNSLPSSFSHSQPSVTTDSQMGAVA